jgi:hypothetical protein
MEAAAVARKLKDERGTKPNGEQAERLTYRTGDKLKEAYGYLESARLAMFRWTQEVAKGTDRMETDAAHLHEVLGIAMALEKQITSLKFKARLYGANGVTV